MILRLGAILQFSALAALLSCQTAVAANWAPGKAKVDEPLAGMLKDMRAKAQWAFYSDCTFGDDTKAVMIFKHGGTEGDFFGLGFRPNLGVKVLSQGRVSTKTGVVRILNVKGAVLHLMPNVGSSLMNRSFRYLHPDELDKIVLNRPIEYCSGEPNTKP